MGDSLLSVLQQRRAGYPARMPPSVVRCGMRDYRRGAAALGLVACDAPLRAANPIYAAALPRELAWWRRA